MFVIGKGKRGGDIRKSVTSCWIRGTECLGVTRSARSVWCRGTLRVYSVGVRGRGGLWGYEDEDWLQKRLFGKSGLGQRAGVEFSARCGDSRLASQTGGVGSRETVNLDVFRALLCRPSSP
ncbi:hypothetical protein O3P69_013777 [Scylla paramamosain]|uniref:Uncharacterized protein n=1 Tax=Scylla paramamosain TaxID=85552 RepID=A0AAW0SPS3_SCYPA